MGAVIGRLAVVGVLGWTLAAQPSNQEDWSGSAAAVFLTPDERRTWKRLGSHDERERFKAGYWRLRDSNSQTPVNEFEVLIRSRIEAADRQFAVEHMAGSRTQRGRVLVLLGPAAVHRIVSGPLDTALRREGALVVLPRAALDAREWHVWVYDRERHPDLMKVLDRRDLELSFIVQPGRTDALQSSGLLSRVRDKVASASIVVRQ